MQISKQINLIAPSIPNVIKKYRMKPARTQGSHLKLEKKKKNVTLGYIMLKLIFFFNSHTLNRLNLKFLEATRTVCV